MSNSANLMSTIAVMVNNLAEKVDECPLNWGHLVYACVQLGLRKLSVIRSSGMSVIQGLLKY